MLGAALREYVLAERRCRFLIENAMFLEHAEGICIEHFRPFVTIVAGSITSRHDVRELHRHASVQLVAFLSHYCLCPCFALELLYVLVESVALGVICHVEKAETHLSHASHRCHEVAALHDAVD